MHNNNIRKARLKAGKSQMQEAIHIDTTEQQIHKWESGKQDITLQRAQRLAQYLGCSIDFLAGCTDMHGTDMKCQE